jgi:hypothetical protein
MRQKSPTTQFEACGPESASFLPFHLDEPGAPGRSAELARCLDPPGAPQRSSPLVRERTYLCGGQLWTCFAYGIQI